MSIHLVECAAALPLRPASKKLVLMAFADSASKDTRLAWPGLEQLMSWSGLKKSQTLAVVSQLVELQLIVKVKDAHTGQRAEYVIFPEGCCELHGPLDGPWLTQWYGSAVPDPSGSDSLDPLWVSTASGTPDPLPPSGSDLETSGSDFPREEGPVAVGPLPKTYSGLTPRGSEVRNSTHHDDNDSEAHPTRLLSSRPVASLPPPCGKCDNRWITNSDGLPVAKCPDCHPASYGLEGQIA